MSRGPQAVKQSNIAKALKGAEKAGRLVSSAIILPDGSIKLDFGNAPAALPAMPDGANEWDGVTG